MRCWPAVPLCLLLRGTLRWLMQNPPAPELLDLCDRMGMVVWDECFDKWDRTADRVNGESLEQYGEKQIRSFAMRDRNHPCIVVWSIANEINPGSGRREGMNRENPARPSAATQFGGGG
ncbi:MAG: glycoside hydrolase family 2 TIM barrel-domain containing protein, partial [Pirellulales bacterium]